MIVLAHLGYIKLATKFVLNKLARLNFNSLTCLLMSSFRTSVLITRYNNLEKKKSFLVGERDLKLTYPLLKEEILLVFF